MTSCAGHPQLAFYGIRGAKVIRRGKDWTVALLPGPHRYYLILQKTVPALFYRKNDASPIVAASWVWALGGFCRAEF